MANQERPSGISPIITTAMKRWKLAENAEHDVRIDSLEDLRFRAGEQWDNMIQINRRTERRPCLTVNRLPQFIRQVTNDARMNRPQIKISATSDDTLDTAKILEGMCRHIQVQSNADIAYDTACDAQVTMGFGYFRVITEYCATDSFDQDIRIKRIKNAFTVYFDPNAVEPDYSDAKWAFIICDMGLDDFKKEYPEASYSSDILASIGDSPQDWMKEDTIRIAEYFEVIDEKKTIHQMPSGAVIDEETLKQAQKIDPTLAPKNSRETTEKKIIWRKISAIEVLEEKPWPGKYIPIVPVLGDDFDIDGERKLVGMVRYAKDPQRMLNYWTSAQTEAIALAPKAPFIMAEGQREGYEKFWDNANMMNYSTLVYKPVSLNGAAVPPPQRNHSEPPVQAMVQAIAQAGEDLKSTTGIYSAGLGKREGDVSGVALGKLQKEGDVSNYHYIDNLSRAIRHLGVIIIDLIPIIYDAPRVMRIIHEDGEYEMVKINQPTGETNPETGIEKIYDVTTGRYDVVVETGPSYSTKRQESAESMTAMAQAYPPLMQIAGDLLVKNFDWAGAQEIAERMKKMLPPQLQGEDGQQPIPPQVQQQMQQMQQMVQQLTQALQQAHDEKDAKTAELNSKERIASQDNETKIVIAEMNNNITAFQEDLNHMREHMRMMQEAQDAEAARNAAAEPIPQANGAAA